jgi:hypothetical protein
MAEEKARAIILTQGKVPALKKVARRGLVKKMGLNCSHDAFYGSYFMFNRLRQIVAGAIGGSFPDHLDKRLDNDLWYWGDGYSTETHPGLFVFMSHSDCDGEISPENCLKVIKDLEALLPEFKKQNIKHRYIEKHDLYIKILKRFIAGCKLAVQNKEPLTYI